MRVFTCGHNKFKEKNEKSVVVSKEEGREESFDDKVTVFST